MFVIFYTVNLYIYDLFHILLSSWHAKDTCNVCMYVCIVRINHVAPIDNYSINSICRNIKKFCI